MIGDAVPFRFSRRILRKSVRSASLSPIKISPKKKIRRPAIKKRTHGVNPSSLKTEKTKVSKKNGSKVNSKQTSKFLKQASCNLKTSVHKRPKKKISKSCIQKRKTKNSLNTSCINSPINEVPLKNNFLESSDRKKKCKKPLDPKNLKSFPSPKERKLSQKESSIQVTNLNSKSVLAPNPENIELISKHSERVTSARFKHSKKEKSVGLKVPVQKLASKSLPVTPASKNASRTYRHSQNRKSGRLSKEPDKLRIRNSMITLCSYSFQSQIETPQPEKHSVRRKSSRLLELSPLSTLNKELSFSKMSPLPRKRPDSIIKKSAMLDKNAELLSFESCKKQNKSKVSNRKISTISHKELKQNQRRRVGKHQKSSENFKKPLSNEIENLPFDALVKPAFKPVRVRNSSKNCSSKSEPKSSKFPFDILTATSFTPALSKSGPKSSKRKSTVSTPEIHVVNEVLQDAKRKKSADFPNIPGKGTLKRKRWLLNNLKEKNECYEDDLFENHNFNQNMSSFHFGDESDGSSVNIATPKFDCILTPALPKKTPRFKDCISPSELLQARKSAEEYLFRRNKKRKSGDKPSSGKKTIKNKKNTIQDFPEKKKLDFEEAVNKLIEVQKNLDMEAEIDDEEEDSYFSDASN